MQVLQVSYHEDLAKVASDGSPPLESLPRSSGGWGWVLVKQLSIINYQLSIDLYLLWGAIFPGRYPGYWMVMPPVSEITQ
jgi:hypothetical protein